MHVWVAELVWSAGRSALPAAPVSEVVVLLGDGQSHTTFAEKWTGQVVFDAARMRLNCAEWYMDCCVGVGVGTVSVGWKEEQTAERFCWQMARQVVTGCLCALHHFEKLSVSFGSWREGLSWIFLAIPQSVYS